MANVSAAILGCAGTTLTAEEAAFFRDVKPWGLHPVQAQHRRPEPRSGP